MRVLFITNLPSPYRVNFFSELGKLCDLTVFFEGRRSRDLTFNWNDDSILSFKPIFFSETFNERKIILSLIRKVISHKYDKIIICTYSTRTQSLLLVLLKMLGISYYFETDGGIIPKTESKFKFLIKKFLIKGAKGYFSTGNFCDKYLIRYGAKREHIFRYAFTSLFNKDIIDNVPTKLQKLNSKEKLGIKYKHVVIGVGQFIHRKGFDVLLEGAKQIEKNVGIYLIGGEPNSKYLEIQGRLQLSNVHYIPFLSQHELRKWFLAADVFVLPTREDVWGLVVNEAMAMALPVITTTECLAGQELIINKECLCPVEDSECLAESINKIIHSQEYLNSISENNLNRIRKFTIEQMVLDHFQALS